MPALQVVASWCAVAEVVRGVEASGYGAGGGPESTLIETPVPAGSARPLTSSPVLGGVTPRGGPVLAGRAACNASSWPSSSVSWLLSFLQWDKMLLPQ